MNALDDALRERGVRRRSATRRDPDPGRRATTPASPGPASRSAATCPQDEAALLVEHGETWEDRGEKGWRRVVASPEPREILDAAAVHALVEAGFVVVANGGGGIPVVREARRAARRRGGHRQGPRGRAARPHRRGRRARGRDRRAARRAAVRHPRGRADIGRVDVRRLRGLAAEGHFASGSMGPKVEAACRFVEQGGTRAVITDLDEHPGRRRRRDRHRRRTHRRRRQPMPEPIDVRKVPILTVSDASGLADLIDDGVLEADRVRGRDRQDRGQRRRQRLHADHRRPGVPRGAGGQGDPQRRGGRSRCRSSGPAAPTACSARTPRSSPRSTPTQVEQTDEPRLTVGFAMSEVLLPEDIGRVAMVTKVADAVRVAMERAGITDVADVHYVQTKTPLLTIHTIRDAKSRGKTVWTEHTHESMDLSNGCTALGIAVALGEIEMPTDADVMHDRSLFSRGRVLLQRRRARPGAGRGGRQRPRDRRPLPDRALGDARRARRRRHLGRRSRTPGSSCPTARTPATCRAGWSTSSSSARSARTARCTGAATRCSTTPTCTGTGRSSPPSAG